YAAESEQICCIRRKTDGQRCPGVPGEDQRFGYEQLPQHEQGGGAPVDQGPVPWKYRCPEDRKDEQTGKVGQLASDNVAPRLLQHEIVEQENGESGHERV